jgi:hypothetical protein
MGTKMFFEFDLESFLVKRFTLLQHGLVAKLMLFFVELHGRKFNSLSV